MKNQENLKPTKRETEILLLIGRGKTSREIATILSLSVDTVATHRKRLCEKLGIHSTASLVAYGLKAAENQTEDRN